MLRFFLPFVLILAVLLALLGAGARALGRLAGGEVLTFTSNRTGALNIYLLDVPRGITLGLRLLPGENFSPLWSPDGSKLAFLSDYNLNRELYVYDAAARTLVDVSQTRGDDAESGAAWSPDGGTLAYASVRDALDIIDTDLYLWDVLNGGNARLTPALDYRDTPAFAPDGRTLAFSVFAGNAPGVYLHDFAGGTVAALAQGIAPLSGTLAWSPDGARLALIGYGVGDDGRVSPGLYVLEVPARALRRLRAMAGYDVHAPHWSPDGCCLLVQAQIPGELTTGLYLLDVARGEERLLVADAAYGGGAAWRRDGGGFVYTVDGIPSRDLYLYDLSSGQRTPLVTHPARDDVPVWMP